MKAIKYGLVIFATCGILYGAYRKLDHTLYKAFYVDFQ